MRHIRSSKYSCNSDNKLSFFNTTPFFLLICLILFISLTSFKIIVDPDLSGGTPPPMKKNSFSSSKVKP